MKSLRKKLQFNFLLTLVVTVLFASCHQQTIDVLPITGIHGEVGKVVISVTNLVQGAQRTIAPSQLTGVDLVPNQYQLKLSGTSGRKTLAERDITLTNGTAVLSNIPEGLWELTLRATSVAGGNGVVAGGIVLEGKALAEVTGTGVVSASFTLVPPETGTGSLLLQIRMHSRDVTALNDALLRKRLVIELFDENDNRVRFSNYNSTGNSSFNAQYPFPHAGVTEFPVGKYELRVTLSMGNSTNYTGLGSTDPLRDAAVMTWTEDIYIEGGRLTSANITLPQLINRAPTVTLRDPSGYTVVENGLYDVDLNWNATAANSYNAKGYEIELLRINNTNTVTNDTNWDNNTGAKYRIDSVPGSTNYFTNSLNSYPVSIRGGMTEFTKSTNVLRLTLAAGRYAYRIRALSDTGNSNWTYGTRILEPFPAVPTIPSSDYFVTTALPANSFSVTMKWNPVEYATTYEIESMLLTPGRVPPANISQFYSDQTFTRYPHTWRTGNSQYFFNKFSNNRPILFRVRATNSAGASDWRYYPAYLNENGAFLPTS